jgi:hypothetical protein
LLIPPDCLEIFCINLQKNIVIYRKNCKIVNKNSYGLIKLFYRYMRDKKNNVQKAINY